MDSLDQFNELTRKGHAHYSIGEYREALGFFKRAFDLVPEEERQATAYGVAAGNLASAYAELGNLRAAKAFFGIALAVHQKRGEEEDAATVHFNLGNVAKYANDWNGTVEHLESAAAIYHRIGNRTREAMARVNLGHFFLNLGAHEIAAEKLEAVTLSEEEIEADHTLAYSYRMLEANLLAGSGQMKPALAAARKALAHATALNHGPYVQEAQATVAQIEAQLGDDSGLPRVLEQQYEAAQAGELRSRPEAAFQLATTLRRRGELERALELIEEAIALVEDRRGQMLESQKTLLMERDHLYFAEQVSLLLDLGRTAEAFVSAEKLQSRTLFERMFRHQIKRQGGRSMSVVAATLQVAPPSWDDVTALAQRDGVHILRLLLLGETLNAWLVLPDGTHHWWDASAALPALAALLESLPTSIFFEETEIIDLGKRGPSNRTHVDRAPLSTFYTALFPPEIREVLEQRRGILMIIPHAQLHQVPWCALDSLGRRWQIAVVPSLSVYDQLDPRRDAGYRGKVEGDARVAIVAGDCGVQTVLYPILPNQMDHVASLHFPALPGARDEARDVAALLGVEPLTGDRFNRRLLYQRLHQANVLHLATHGLWHPVAGEFSFLLLASEGDSPSVWTATQIGQRIVQAELVVLSACQTGLGQSHPDSYLGLPQSFLIAGARAVLVSLWPISDEATHAFMLELYRALQRGQSPAAALQSAQSVFEASKQFADPFAWAGFQLIGRPLEPVWKRPAIEPADGPIFCGGDLLLLDHPFNQPFDVAAHQDIVQRGYGEGLMIRSATVVGRIPIHSPGSELDDIWMLTAPPPPA